MTPYRVRGRLPLAGVTWWGVVPDMLMGMVLLQGAVCESHQVAEGDSDFVGVPVGARVVVRRVFFVGWAEVDYPAWFLSTTAFGWFFGGFGWGMGVVTGGRFFAALKNDIWGHRVIGGGGRRGFCWRGRFFGGSGWGVCVVTGGRFFAALKNDI